MTTPRALFVGIDLAWGYRARTGFAVVDENGQLVDIQSLLTDEDIRAAVAVLPGVPVVVAVDAPLVVTNLTGQREAEKAIGRAYGRFGASCHTTNLSRTGPEGPRAAALARQHGWTMGPTSRGYADAPVCIEVYPHAALVGLFDLPYRILYKKGTVEVRRAGFADVVRCLESWDVLRLTSSTAWTPLRADIAAAVRHVDLNLVEDQLDAVICAGLALLWHQEGEARLHVFGTVDADHIVAPRPPTHPAVRPAGSGNVRRGA